MSESVARRAFEIIDPGEVDYWEPGENSLARLSTCEPLDASEVAAQLGITSSDVVSSYPTRHQCRWGRTGGYTAHGEFGLGEGLREYAALRVVIPISAGRDACAIVRTLAASAWANLPAP